MTGSAVLAKPLALSSAGIGQPSSSRATILGLVFVLVAWEFGARWLADSLSSPHHPTFFFIWSTIAA